ncbi:MAG: hypothetical protein KGJ63_01970 [Pseudomonadota bacterium]|jgi:thiamine-phosphate pyrophosphorylase|nr:hypothetical protein [Pseudomonadota bacterium]
MTTTLAPQVPAERLRQSAAPGVPRVAVGSITPDNGAAAVAAGAAHLAAVSAVFGATDARNAAPCFTDLYPSTSGTPS